MDISTPSINYSISKFEAQIDKETVKSTRKITFVIAAESTGSAHRNGYMYDWSNWQLDSFNANPIVGYQHNVYGDNMCLAPNPDDVIAKATAWMDTYKGKRSIVSEAEFEPAELNPTAEKIFQKIQFGSLTAVSVGVLPTGEITKTSSPDRGVLYSMPGQTLVEWSVVHIPADPDALRRSMKSHTMAALSYAQRQLPHLSMHELEKMTVKEIMESMESRFSSNKPGLSPDDAEKLITTLKQRRGR